MASVERAAYPRFRRFMSARELHVFYTPAAEEIAWARENASSDQHLLGLGVRRHLEACVFTCLAEQLRTGDIGVDGAGGVCQLGRPADQPGPCAADAGYYVLTTFCHGTSMGPAQTVRHITAVTAHELSVTVRRHVTVDKLDKAIAGTGHRRASR